MTAMTDKAITEAKERAVLAAAMQSVAVECVHFDGAEQPLRRRLMPIAGLLAPLVTSRLGDGLRDAS